MPLAKLLPFPLHKRKKIYLLKTLLPFLCLVFIIAFLSQQNLVEISNYLRYKVYSHYGPPKDLKSLRYYVLQENTDEFLEDVLKQVSFIEVDLKKCRQNTSEQARYDKEIMNDERKVIPNLGEKGKAATVRPRQRSQEAAVMKMEGFNRLLSEMIPLNRTVPDTRELSCRLFIYDTSSLPTMSVIIIFSNEAYVSIIRMLIGLINRTPEHLLKEIILVDDFSDREDLKGKFERFLATRFPVNKIRLLRLSKRSGLMRSRMIGAHVAVGDVLIFLDAHCEVIEEWSEPLLQRIQKKRTTVVVPVIDVIDSKTLEYSVGNGDYFFIGGFKWSGHFHWIKVPEYEEKTKKHHYEPTRTPTMPGGLFGIDRKYFWEMGSYDPGMEIWGAENLEMSFRIWQCGGTVETIPCSRMGHIFRPFRPYSFEPKNNRRNVIRTAAVWMDDYKELVFQYGTLDDFGDVQSRRALRKRKKCNSFQWYLDNIYKHKFLMERDSTHWGQVKNTLENYCLDDMGNTGENYQLEVYPCHPKLYPSQTYYLSKKHELRKETVCAEAEDSGKIVRMKPCDYNEDKHFKWEYTTEIQGGRLMNKATKKCLTVKPKNDGNYEVLQETCGSASGQNWFFVNYNGGKT